MIIHSAFSLSQYEACPYRWYLMYKIKIYRYELPTPAQLLGKSFHRTVKSFLKSKSRNQKWLYYIWKQNKKRINNECFEMVGDIAIECWWQWYKNVIVLKKYIPKKIEGEFNNSILGANFKGYIDSIFKREDICLNEDKYLISDWKTGSWEIKNINDVDKILKDSMQLYIYGCMVAESLKVDTSRIDIALYFAAHDKYVVCPLTESTAEMKIQKCLEDISEGNYRKIKGDSCSYCPYKDSCDDE